MRVSWSRGPNRLQPASFNQRSRKCPTHRLLPGFASHWIDTDAGKSSRVRMAPGRRAAAAWLWRDQYRLAQNRAPARAALHRRRDGFARLWLVVRAGQREGENYTKRLMAADAVKVMESLGHIQFALAGMIAARASACASRSIIRDGSPNSRCSTSLRWRRFWRRQSLPHRPRQIHEL